MKHNPQVWEKSAVSRFPDYQSAAAFRALMDPLPERVRVRKRRRGEFFELVVYRRKAVPK